jgi:hypothetical protein
VAIAKGSESFTSISSARIAPTKQAENPRLVLAWNIGMRLLRQC